MSETSLSEPTSKSSPSIMIWLTDFILALNLKNTYIVDVDGIEGKMLADPESIKWCIYNQNMNG